MKRYFSIAFVGLLLFALVFFLFKRCQAALDFRIPQVQKIFSKALPLTPEIRVNHLVVFAQKTSITELALVQKEELVELKLKEAMRFWETEVPLTYQELEARSIYRIKAGFDLSQPFVVNIDPETNHIEAILPPAKILSVERVGPLTMRENYGWLASITLEERTKLLNQLDQLARQFAEQSGLIEEAEQEVIKRLRPFMEEKGQPSIQLKTTSMSRS